jgi:hypothetical protein
VPASQPERPRADPTARPRAGLHAATRIERLARYLLDGGPDDALEVELPSWLEGSSAFSAFADRHRDKIRKKLRGATDPEARLDVRAEIRAAQLLLADRRIDVSFEAYGSSAVGPDLTLSLRGAPPFNVEVTRLRHPAVAASLGSAIVAKLRQLPPAVANVLLIAVDGEDAGAVDVGSSVRAMRALADRRDAAFLARGRYDSARAFYDRFLRLGAIVVWCEQATGAGRAAAWINGSARIAVPPRAMRACVTCLRAG